MNFKKVIVPAIHLCECYGMVLLQQQPDDFQESAESRVWVLLLPFYPNKRASYQATQGEGK